MSADVALVRAWYATENLYAAAAESGWSKSSAHRRLTQLGIKMKGNRAPVSDEAAERAYFDCGKSIHRAARRLGISPTAVSRRLEARGIERNGHKTAVSPDEAARLYLSTESSEIAAAALNVSRNTVLRRLDEAGIKRLHGPRALDLDLVRARYLDDLSTYKTADAFDVSQATIVRRLREAGMPLTGVVPGRYSSDELAVLRSEYADARDAGRLDHLAAKLGRSTASIKAKAVEEGLTDQHAPNLWSRIWLSKSDDELRALLAEQSKLKLGTYRFAAVKGLSPRSYIEVMRTRLSSEYQAVVDIHRGWSKTGVEQKDGWNFEGQLANQLRRAGLSPFLSKGSLGPADLLAISPNGTIYAIQAKSGGQQLRKEDWNKLWDFAATMNAVPVLAERPGLDTEFWQLLERKDPDRVYRRQPRQRIDLTA